MSLSSQEHVKRRKTTSSTEKLTLSSYRLDVAVQEAHWVDGFDGLEDLLPEPKGGAHGEGSSGLTPPQVGQVTTLQQHTAILFWWHHLAYSIKIYLMYTLSF